MADPLNRPKTWPKNYQYYVEKHEIYGVFQELIKQLIILKPDDPLTYIRDEISKIAKSLHHPRVFLIGSKAADVTAKSLASQLGAKYLKLEDIILGSSQKNRLISLLDPKNPEDEELNNLLVSTIKTRVSQSDCQKFGYFLSGFPQTKTQGLHAQQVGLLPRQVYVFTPQKDETSNENAEDKLKKGNKAAESPSNNEIQLFILKEIASIYNNEICKVIPHEKLMRKSKQELENELLGHILTSKPTGEPFIPRVIIIGPPGSGKSFIAEFLSAKFSIVNFDWIEMVRGAARWDDGVSEEATSYLNDLTPMSDDAVKTLLSRNMLNGECEKKGWVLHGFPETLKHCKILESLFLAPNRIFMLACTKEISMARNSRKKKQVLQRQLHGVSENNDVSQIDETGDHLLFPWGEKVVSKRYDMFTINKANLMPYYGNRVIRVDASMKPSDIKNFVSAAIFRPPIPKNPASVK